MSATLFDSHCHLEDKRFTGEVEAVLGRMREAGVERCILAGSDVETSEHIAQIVEAHENVYGVVGVHPHEAKGFAEDTLLRLSELLTQPRIVGVGEIGLDYYYDFSPREAQREAFDRQLVFAYEKHVPAVFHVRDAHGDTLDVFRAHRGRLPAGVLHCYTGSVESAREYLTMGFYISFSGAVTFQNAHNLQEAARYVPLDRLLVETDSPYLAPVPMRGKHNEPAYVRYVAEKVAQLRGITLEALAEQTTANVERLYGIPALESALR
ncbi:MAG: TatD family hydrolase [Eubacteriales bacterium]|nr:TatD family hydrolase [Eubacteriales bacterium]